MFTRLKQILVVSAIFYGSHIPFANAQELPVNQVRFVAGPDISNFAQTTSVTQVLVQANGTELQFSKKDGAGRWPDNVTPGWAGALQYSIGMCVNVSGEWVCSAPIEVWFGRVGATGPIQDNTVSCAQGYHGQVACNWFYDNRWGPLNGHQPAPGEQIGMFVVAGDARNNFNPIRERSNIVLLTMPNPGETRTFNYNEVVPQPVIVTPPPAPPVVVPPPPPVVVVPPPPPPVVPQPIDVSNGAIAELARQVLACNQSIEASRVENQAFYASVKSTWQSIGGPFLLKYVLPAVSASLATWKLTK